MPLVGSASACSSHFPGRFLPWLVLSFFVWLGSASAALAQTANWAGNSSTDWGTAANWDTNTVPVSNGTAVILDTNTGNQAVYASGTSTVGNITVGNTTASGANTSLTIQGGNLTGGVLYIGNAAGASGNVLITGAGTQFTANKSDTTVSSSNPANIEVGRNGMGCLTIANGAHVRGQTYVGFFAGSNGTLLVTGDGTSLDSNSHLQLGFNGTGNVTFADGASLTALDILLSGNNHTLTITGQAASGNRTTINLTNTLQATSNDSSILIANGAQITVASISTSFMLAGINTTMTVTDPGTAVVLNHGSTFSGALIGAQLTIANGASVTSNYTGNETDIGSNRSGNVTVTGNNSSWAVTGNLIVGSTSNGTLTIANGGTVSVGSGNLTIGRGSNGTLNLNSGGVLQLSSGIVTNGANATFNWAGGVLRQASNGTLSGNAILSTAGGGIIDSNGHNFAYSGLLSGAGNFTKNGAGNLTLSAANNYTGATIINQGTLTINNTTHFTGDCIDNASLVLNWGNSSYAGTLSGNGNLTVSGQLTMTGNNNTFSGNINLPAPSITNNTLTLAGDTSQFNCTINLASLGLTKPTVAFNSTIDTTFPGAISGNGFILKSGTGNLTLSANNALAGFQADNPAALSIRGPLIFTGDTSNTPMVRIHMIGGGLTFNQPMDSTFNGNMDAWGNFTHAGPGTLTYIGRLSLSGNMTINSGTLVVSGWLTLDDAFNVANNGTLVLNQNLTWTYGGTITGTGALIENGTTVFRLSGNNTYTGPTIINGGTLAIDGNLAATSNVSVNNGGTLAVDGSLAAASNVSVNSGGTLAGIGNIAGPVTVNAGGILTPGDSGLGTLTVGSLTFASGAAPNFLISSPGNASSVAVAGALTYGGNLTLNLSTTLQTGTYSLFTSASHSGDFASVTLGGLLSGVLTESGGVWSGTYLGFGFSLDQATGLLTITSSFPPGTSATKQVWLASNFNSTQLADSSISGDSASPAHDGIPNLVKYAFSLDPWINGRASLPQSSLANGRLTLTFVKLRADLVYTVEESTDMIEWDTSDNLPFGLGLTVQTDGTTVTASRAVAGPPGVFLHIVITPAP